MAEPQKKVSRKAAVTPASTVHTTPLVGPVVVWVSLVGFVGISDDARFSDFAGRYGFVVQEIRKGKNHENVSLLDACCHRQRPDSNALFCSNPSNIVVCLFRGTVGGSGGTTSTWNGHCLSHRDTGQLRSGFRRGSDDMARISARDHDGK